MIVDGKKIAQEILGELKKEIEDRKLKLQLAAVLVCPKGIEESELKKFVELKGKTAKLIGISFKSYFFDEDISEDELIKEVQRILADRGVSGVFIELPLPKHIDAQNIFDVIPSNKDPDVLSKSLQDKFFSGNFFILPPAVESLKIVFEKYGVNPKGKKAAVFGQGFLVGKPISYWLEKNGAKVCRIDIHTKNPGKCSRESDLIISGVGKFGLVTGDIVKDGVIVVDFGYGKKNGKILGDVDFKSVSAKALLITPVPGGMGPILIATVLKNLVKLNS